MASTLTPNLKLRLSASLSSDAQYNLNKIDELAGTFLVDSTGATRLRSQTDITLLPEDTSKGGSGTGGTISLGTNAQKSSSVAVYADAFSSSAPLSLLDQAAGGTKYLVLKYKSDTAGSVDTAADRTLTVDLQGADRSLILGGSLTLSGGSLTLTTSADSSLTLPTTGTLATLAGTETLTNKTLDAGANTITGLTNAAVSNTAAIAYSKLNLTGALVNADVSPSAAIAYTKLVLTGQVQTTDLSPNISIPYDNLDIANAITNSDIAPGAGIEYAKLALAGSITNSDIATEAAISGSKVDPSFGAQQIKTSDSLQFTHGGRTTVLQPAQSGQSIDLSFSLPPDAGADGQVLSTDGAGTFSWIDAVGTGTVTSVDLSVPSILSVSGGPVTTSGTLALGLATQVQKTFLAGPTSGSDATPTFRTIAKADLPSLTSSDVSEGSNLYFTNERVDDRVSALLQPGTGISLSYDDTAGTLTVGTGITQYTDEMAQDAVGANLVDGTTVDLTYDDTAGTITAEVVETAINHDNLLNWDANKHIDHSTVNISTAANSGLSGGGAINNSRSLLIDPSNLTAKATPVAADTVLLGDSAASFGVKKATLSTLASAIGFKTYKTDWAAADGASKTVTHSLGTTDVLVQVFDKADGTSFLLDSIARTDANTVTLTSSQSPGASGFRVLIFAF